MSRGKIIAGIVALIVVGGIVAGVVVSAQNAVPLVTVAKVTQENLGVIVTASGKIEAAQKADVFCYLKHEERAPGLANQLITALAAGA